MGNKNMIFKTMTKRQNHDEIINRMKTHIAWRRQAPQERMICNDPWLNNNAMLFLHNIYYMTKQTYFLICWKNDLPATFLSSKAPRRQLNLSLLLSSACVISKWHASQQRIHYMLTKWIIHPLDRGGLGMGGANTHFKPFQIQFAFWLCLILFRSYLHLNAKLVGIIISTRLYGDSFWRAYKTRLPVNGNMCRRNRLTLNS